MRSQSLSDAAREYIWLYDRRHGLTLRAIADGSGVSIGQVRAGLIRAEAADAAPDPVSHPLRLVQPRLMPLFGVGMHTPLSICPHHGPIPPGSVLCCMICHQSGQDAHPALQPSPDDPTRDPPSVVVPKPAPPPAPKETRAVQRARKFAGP